MQFVRRFGERLARPRYMHADELSPHLMRDVGLADGRATVPRSWP